MSAADELWRRWLEDPAISRAAAEPAVARRRGGRAQQIRGTHSGPAATENSGRRRGLVVGAVLLAAVGAVIATLVITSMGGQPRGERARPYAVLTTVAAAASSRTPAGAPPFCSPGMVGATIITNSAGDRASGPGVIAAYEHAFFVARDARVALDVTDRGPGLPAEPQLAQGIAAVPVGAPWCVSITDTGGGAFETAVRYLPGPGQEPVLWLLKITVTEDHGVYTIVRIDDKA
ncbi:hypothetical protein [Nocardia sp. NPDC004260]